MPVLPVVIIAPTWSTQRICGDHEGQRWGRRYRSHTSSGEAGPRTVSVKGLEAGTRPSAALAAEARGGGFTRRAPIRPDSPAAVAARCHDPSVIVDDRTGAEGLADRLARLARVTTLLTAADEVEAVASVVVEQGADAAGASVAWLTLREGEDHCRLVGLRGGQPGDQQRWATYPLTMPAPGSDAIRTGERVVVSGTAEIDRRYPDLAAARLGGRSVVALPLTVGSRATGAIGLLFAQQRDFDATELELLEIMADSCAQALQRIAAQDAATRQSTRLTFLADASTELASSLDYQTTLANVARLAVPTQADWCAIDLVVDGRLHRLAVEHVDPAKVQLARDLAERYPADPDAPTGAWHVMRTGRSQVIAEVTDEMLVAGAVDDEHLRIARDLHLRSALTVPLVARERVLGVMTWVSAESERLYTEADLALAEDLAGRAAVAIDNAELHSETLAAAVQLQHAVLPESLPQVDGWEVAGHYSPAGRTEIGGDFYDAVPLADGRLVLFVGDVMGRGVAAAAAMAQMRSAVRAYTAIDPEPQAVLENLDRMFAQYPTDQLVTLVYLLVDPARDELLVGNAGHPPPVVLRGDGGRTEQLPLAEGPPLGAATRPRTVEVVRFGAGDTVMAFTDGLIERREEEISQGQQRVLEELGSLAVPDLAAALDAVVERLRDPARDDDVAALAARRTPYPGDRPAP